MQRPEDQPSVNLRASKSKVMGMVHAAASSVPTGLNVEPCSFGDPRQVGGGVRLNLGKPRARKPCLREELQALRNEALCT